MSNPFIFSTPDPGIYPDSSRIMSPGKLSLHSRSTDYPNPDPSGGSPKFGVINYSPKHSRKPSSLTSNRNISMKSLSLDLNNDNGLLYSSNSSGSSFDFKQKRKLNVAIPESGQAKPRPQTIQLDALKTPNVTKTPVIPPPIPMGPLKSASSIELTSENFKFPSFDEHSHDNDSQNFHSPLEKTDASLVGHFNSMSLKDKKRVPEELQELSQLDAYPNGPANVLNGSIYLYSEPSVQDINQYDLIINVAKECKDLTVDFTPDTGKKYVYIPWLHTSPISKELPSLVKLIQEFDDSDRLGPKRKILIHCHCGVSRSACVIVAYFMLKFQINVNEAYELLKSGTANTKDKINQEINHRGYDIEACKRVCPNMSLIFELMDFNDYLKSVNYVL